MLIISPNYTIGFKNIVRIHLEEGRTYKSITVKYGVSKAGISKWYAQFNEEFQNKAFSDPGILNEAELMRKVYGSEESRKNQKRRSFS